MPPQSAPPSSSSSSSSIHLSFLFLFLSLGHISLTLAQNSSQAGQTTQVLISYSRADYIFSPSILTLKCVPGNEEATFWRILDNATEQVVSSGLMVETSITFDVTPDREGEYYCRINGINSSTSIEIVAYPLLNDTIKSIKSYTAVLNSDTTIPCVFTRGVLHKRYSIQWFKGLTQINTSDPRFRINSDDFSLVINRVNALDASSAYYCAVHVDVRFLSFDDYHRIGPSVELVITDSLTVTQPLVSAVVSPGSQQQFSCTVFGLPPPSIMWLYQGSSIAAGNQGYVEMSRLQVSTDTNGTTVSSQLSFTGLQESHSGLVQCLVMQRAMEGGEDTVLSSVATLTVLPSSFQPTALPTGNGMEVSLTLPTALPSSFSLVIYYYDTKDLLVGKSELVDAAFADIREVDYLVTGDKLPSILTFYLQIAVKVAGMEGSRSQSSNTITITERGQATNSPNSIPDPECDCSEASANTTTIQTILVIFIVFLIVLLTGALGVAIWGVVFMLRRARVKKTDSIGSFDDERSYDTKSHSPSRSRSSHRSRSRSWSQTSRSRSRSFTSSSRSPSPSATEISNRSLSRVHSPSHDSVSTRGGREEPEGRYDDDEYVTINGAQPIKRERSNTCTTLPLPTEPFRESEEGTVKSSEANEYEELQFAKAKKRGKGRRGEREQQTVPKEQLQPADSNAEALSVV